MNPLFLIPIGLIAFAFATPTSASSMRKQPTAKATAPTPSITTASVSASGQQFIRRAEAFRSHAYRDAAGFWTIGYGHKIVAGDNLSSSSVITEDYALALFAQDLLRTADAVRSSLQRAVTQGQFDAMVSLAYNIGVSAFRNSTLLRLVNAGDLAGAATQFARWIYAGGQALAGLLTRRRQEAALFTGGRA